LVERRGVRLGGLTMAVLRLGSKGNDVKKMQEGLNKAMKPSPKLKADGQFGPATDKAVREFQKKNKLRVDGIAGKNTVGAINSGGKGAGATGGDKKLKMDMEDYARLKKQMANSHNHHQGEHKMALKTIEASVDRSEYKKLERAISVSWNKYMKAYKTWDSLADKVMTAQKKFKGYGKSDQAMAKLWLEHAQKTHADAMKQSKVVTASVNQMQKVKDSALKQIRATKRR
jgi:hypothetical protein